MGYLPVRGGAGNDGKEGAELNDQRAELDVEGLMEEGRNEEDRALCREGRSEGLSSGEFRSRQGGTVLVDDDAGWTGVPCRDPGGSRFVGDGNLLRRARSDILIVVKYNGRS